MFMTTETTSSIASNEVENNWPQSANSIKYKRLKIIYETPKIPDIEYILWSFLCNKINCGMALGAKLSLWIPQEYLYFQLSSR